MYFEEEDDVKDVEGSIWFTKLSEKVQSELKREMKKELKKMLDKIFVQMKLSEETLQLL
jgi:hypothetical protein